MPILGRNLSIQKSGSKIMKCFILNKIATSITLFLLLSCSPLLPSNRETLIHTVYYYGYTGYDLNRNEVLLDLISNGTFELYCSYRVYHGRWEKDGRIVILRLDNPREKQSWVDDFQNQLFYSDIIRVKITHRPLNKRVVYKSKLIQKWQVALGRKQSFDIVMRPFPSDAPVYKYRPEFDLDSFGKDTIHSIEPIPLPTPKIMAN